MYTAKQKAIITVHLPCPTITRSLISKYPKIRCKQSSLSFDIGHVTSSLITAHSSSPSLSASSSSSSSSSASWFSLQTCYWRKLNKIILWILLHAKIITSKMTFTLFWKGRVSQIIVPSGNSLGWCQLSAADRNNLRPCRNNFFSMALQVEESMILLLHENSIFGWCWIYTSDRVGLGQSLGYTIRFTLADPISVLQVRLKLRKLN